MERKEELKHQLNEQIKSMIPLVMEGENIGSLIFWNDDYGAFIKFAKWKVEEFPWSFPLGNNIDLQEFDVFDYDDMALVSEVLKEFYHELRTSPSFLKLPLRKGFQFCYFDSQIGEHLDGINDVFNFTLEEAIGVIIECINKYLLQSDIEKLEQINFSSEEQNVSLMFSGNDQYEYYSYDNLDVGFALTTLIQSAENNFYTLCEHIIKNENFTKTSKNECVEFKILLNEEEFFVVDYNVDSGKLTKGD